MWNHVSKQAWTCWTCVIDKERYTRHVKITKKDIPARKFYDVEGERGERMTTEMFELKKRESAHGLTSVSLSFFYSHNSVSERKIKTNRSVWKEKVTLKLKLNSNKMRKLKY